jgi:hypothetical protein
MSENKKPHHRHEGPDRDNQGLPPYWKRAHHDWRFWVALVFMLAAITIYVLSDDMRFLPLSPPQQPLSGAVGQ